MSLVIHTVLVSNIHVLYCSTKGDDYLGGGDYDILQSPIGATLMKSKCYNDNCNGSQHKHSCLLT